MSGELTKTVWLVNRGGHDYSNLPTFGRVLDLTTGNINPFNLDRMMVLIAPRLQLATAEDWLAISGLPILNGVAMLMWLTRFDRLNLLQYSVRRSEYVPIFLTGNGVRANALLDTHPAD